MAEYEPDTISGLVRSLLNDTRDLIREEIAFARVEIRDEMAAARTVGVAVGAAAIAALIGVTVLCVAIGGGIAYALDWPAWSGYAIVGVLLLIGAFVAAQVGKTRLASIRALPKTTETLKENIAWMQSKSGDK